MKFNKTLLAFLLAMNALTVLADECQTETQLQNEKVGITRLIENSQACNKDQDCTLVYLGCPFGCGVGINKTNETEIISAVDAYLAKSCTACKYRCSAKIITTQCIQNRCSTE